MHAPTIINDFEKRSRYLIYTPSVSGLPFSITGAGHFFARSAYYVERDNLRNMYLVIYTVNGLGSLSYRGQTFLIPPHHAVLINGEEYHNYRCSAEQGNVFWEFKWIRFSSLFAGKYDEMILHGGSEAIVIPDDTLDEHIESVLALLSDNVPVVNQDVMLSCHVMDVLTYLSECTDDHRGEPEKSAYATMLSCRDTILNSYEKALTVSMLANQACMSKEAFIRKFKKHFAVTPYDLLLNTRLHHAAMLLETMDGTISEICYRVGFQSLNNFSKQFQLLFGQSPSQYRAQFHSASQ